MAFALTSDPILSLSDAKALLDLSTDQQAILAINSLSQKAKRYLNRVQINEDTTTAIVERLRPYGGDTLHLHAPIWTGAGFAISAAVYESGLLQDTYTHADGELRYVTSDYASRIILDGYWPDDRLNGYIEVTYKGGWSTIPADVIQGAIMQGRVDQRRQSGEVGVTSRGVQGESTQYQIAGIIREVADLWDPYKVLV